MLNLVLVAFSVFGFSLAANSIISPYLYSKCPEGITSIDPTVVIPLGIDLLMTTYPFLNAICDVKVKYPTVVEDMSKYLKDPALTPPRQYHRKASEVGPSVFLLVRNRFYDPASGLGAIDAVKLSTELNKIFDKFLFFDSLTSLELGAPFSQTYTSIIEWPLFGLQKFIIEQIGREAWEQTIKALLVPEGAINLNEFMDTKIHQHIDNIYRSIGTLSVNFIQVNPHFAHLIADRLMRLFVDVSDDAVFSKNQLYRSLPEWLQKKVKTRVFTVRNKISELSENDDPASAIHIISAGFGVMTEEELLNDLVKHINLALPDICQTQADIYHELSNLREAKMSRILKYAISVLTVFGCSILVVIVYRYVPFKTIINRLKPTKKIE